MKIELILSKRIYFKGIVKCTPLVVNKYLYFGSYDKFLYKLNIANVGSCEWKIKIRSVEVYCLSCLFPHDAY